MISNYLWEFVPRENYTEHSLQSIFVYHYVKKEKKEIDIDKLSKLLLASSFRYKSLTTNKAETWNKSMICESEKQLKMKRT